MNAISPTLANVCPRTRLYQAQLRTPLPSLHAVLDVNCNIGHGFFLFPLLLLFLLDALLEVLLNLEVDAEFGDGPWGGARYKEAERNRKEDGVC